MKKVLSALLAVVMISSMAMAQMKTINLPVTKASATRAAAAMAAKGGKAMLKQAAPVYNYGKSVISNFPYTEGFETANSDWTMVDSDNDGFTWYVGDVNNDRMTSHSGNGFVASDSYDNNTEAALNPDNWLISSQIQLPASATDFVLSWWDAAQDPNYPAEHYSVYVATANTVSAFTATTAVFTTTLSTDEWTKRTVDLSAYAGQNVYVAFRHHGCSDMFVMKIDDIRIGGPEAPTVAISAPASAESGTPVTLTANYSGATSVAWTINGATPATATTDQVVATWAAAGTYDIVATVTNAVGTASDTAQISIYACELIDSFPYTVNFADGLGCWNRRADSVDNPGWLTAEEAGLEGFNGILSMSAQSLMGLFMIDMPTDNWLTSPQIVVPAAGEYELAWQVMPYAPDYAADHYTVYAIANGVETPLFTETLDGQITAMQTRVASLSAYAGDTIRVAFRHHDSRGGYVILLDNIGIQTLSAPYLTLSGSDFVRANDPATFVATSGNADSYAWTVDGAAMTETSSTFTHSFTTAGTHTVAVTATNTVGSTSDSMTVTVIECSAITAMPYTEDFEGHILCWTLVSRNTENLGRMGITEMQNGSHSGTNAFVFSSYAEANDYNQYLITPEISLTEGAPAVKFWYKGYNNQESFRVLYSTTGNAPADFTHVLANIEAPATEWTLFGAALPLDAKYVAINYYADYQYYLYIDDFEISAMSAPMVSVSAPARAFVNDQVTFTATGVMADTYSWTIDGAADACTSNVLTTSFATAGTHTVEVTATNSIGSASATATINVIAWGDTMYYDNGEFESACGVDGTPIYWGVKFEAASLAGRNFLTDVMFFAPEQGAGTYQVMAYQGGDNAPATKVGEKFLDVTAAGSWQTAHMPISVALDATKPLWIVLQSPSVSYPAAYTAFCGNYNSSWVSVDGQEWSDIETASNGQLSGSWMIRAITADNATAGIDQVATVEMTVYPNPTSDRISILAEGVKLVEVLDINGRAAMSTTSSSVDMSSLSAGVYFVRVITNNGVRIEKVIKK